MNQRKEFTTSLFHWALALILITLPFPNYILNSISIIICLIAWIFYSSFRDKYLNLKQNLPLFLLLSSLFWISLIGLLYSQDKDEGLRNVVQMLPFLVLPLIFVTVKINATIKENVLKIFSYSVLLAAGFALSKALFFYIYDLGNYFFFDRLALLLDKHTTYFALFSLVAINYFIHFHSKKNKTYYIFYTLFLCGMLYMLSVRISVIGLFLSLIIYLYSNRQKLTITSRGFILLMTFLVFAAYLTPNFQKRFNAKTVDGIEISDINERKIHWNSVIDRIQQENIWIGSGTGDGHIGLYQTYQNNEFSSGFIYKYNAHNQYLETILYYGIVGLLCLISILFYLFRSSIMGRNYFAISFTLVCMIFMLTESILERQSGIVLLAYFTALFTPQTKNNGLLVIGPYPPPVGGISLFVKGLENFIYSNFNENVKVINELDNYGEHKMYSLSSTSRIKYLYRLSIYMFYRNKFKHVYYNGVHGEARWFLTLMGKMLGYKLILHFHGQSVVNFHNSNYLNRKMSRYSLKNAFKILTVNERLLQNVKEIIPSATPLTMPAYLPFKKDCKNSKISAFLESLAPYKTYFLSYGTLDKDKDGNYNYGIKRLINFFSSEFCKDKGFSLIFVLILYKEKDIQEYNHQLKSMFEVNIENIKLYINSGSDNLNQFFDFVKGYIRWTSEDGLGVSLYEALEHGLITVASNVCERPEGTLIFDKNKPEELKELLMSQIDTNIMRKPITYEKEYEKFFIDIGFTLKK